MKSVMVEFNRFGKPGGTYQEGNRYIRTAPDQETREIEVGLDYRTFVKFIHRLRYPKGVTPEKIEEAIARLGSEAGAMLCDLACDPGEPTQIDLITGAAELKAFPFEAHAKPGLILTRRIRANFGEPVVWPAVPKVLFAHAAVGGDLKASLVADHVAALKQALRPWTGGDENTVGRYLVVRQVPTLEALQQARDEDAFTHVHLLAHGIPVDPPDEVPIKDWGMRLGLPGTKGVHPADVASVLAPRSGLPVAVTVASCDSANQSESAAESYSIAHELHRRGVPVVVASQLPLTMHGSVLLTHRFYEPVLRGIDVRSALDDAREALRQDAKAFHDWLSVVAYVRLPENYTQHLATVALKMELAMLNAARKRAEQVIHDDDRAALKDVEALVRDRIASLEARLRNLEAGEDRLECQGLLASAHKRLAELLFLQERSSAEQRVVLEAALQHYRAAFESDLNAHWHGVQQLALQTVLHGGFDQADHDIVLRVAKRKAQDPAEFWALGTMAELHLLSGALDAARDAVALFRERTKGNPTAVDSTRHQLRSYVDWWTPAHGFETDLAAPAAELAGLL